MYGSVLEHVLSTNPHVQNFFHGFGNPDILQKKIRAAPSLYILNTAPSSSPGEHWCVVCFFRGRIAYFFDSYGKPPGHYDLTEILAPYADHVYHNSKCVQGETAKTCGHHCIYFSVLLSYGNTPDEIMATYDNSSMRKNDNMVYKFVADRFGELLAKIIS